MTFPRMTPAEEAEYEDNRSVALAQPHRRGSDDLRCGSELWEACRRMRLRDELFTAGERYGEISRAYKASLGIGVGNIGNGWAPIDDAQAIAAAKLAKDQYWACLRVLRAAHHMASAALERVCYDNQPPLPSTQVPLKLGLYAVARHLGVLNLGINEDKGL